LFLNLLPFPNFCASKLDTVSPQSFGLKKFGLKTIAKQKANANIPTIKYISAMEFAECVLRVLFQILVGWLRKDLSFVLQSQSYERKTFQNMLPMLLQKKGKHVQYSSRKY